MGSMLTRLWSFTRSPHMRILSVTLRHPWRLDAPYTPSHPGHSYARPPPAPDSYHQKRHTWRDHERGGHLSYLLHRDVLALRIAWCQGDDSQSQQNRFAGSLTWDWNSRNLNERDLLLFSWAVWQCRAQAAASEHRHGDEGFGCVESVGAFGQCS